MSKLKIFITGLADAIRIKNKKNEEIVAKNIPQAIRDIVGGINADGYIIYNNAVNYATNATRPSNITMVGNLERFIGSKSFKTLNVQYNPFDFGMVTTATDKNPNIVNIKECKKIPAYLLRPMQSTKVHFLDDEVEEFGEFSFSSKVIAMTCEGVPDENSFPPKVTTIPNNCFKGNKMYLLLPDRITDIGTSAFHQTSKAQYIMNNELPTSLKTIGSSAFYYQTIPFTKMPAGVTSIGSKAFYSNTNLLELTFLGTPEEIASDAFSGCTNLKTINVPWASGEVANAPWGATNATINYGYKGG